MPHGFLLIRHALPTVDPSVGSEHWSLSQDSSEAAGELGRKLAPLIADAVVLAGAEAKMVETAEALVRNIPTATVQRDERVGEVRRPWVDGDYQAEAMRYLTERRVEGWEARDDVRRRFDDAVMEQRGRAVVVTGGLAMSIWIDSMWPDLDVRWFWQHLTLPDAWLLEKGALRRVA